MLTDAEVEAIIENFHRAAVMAQKIGFDFVDIKHCHGYLGHEFLSAHTREGRYGGSFENRTRFLREVVEGIRSLAPGLGIAVRLSAFDSVPFQPDPRTIGPKENLALEFLSRRTDCFPTAGDSAWTHSIRPKRT